MVPAILGTARLANFRLGYVPAALTPIRVARVTVLLAGLTARVREDTGTIQDQLNDAPNTAQLTVDGTAPTEGQRLRITINSDAPRLLFNGTLQTVSLSYDLLATQLAWQVTAIDDLARLNRRRPFGTWTQVPADTVALQLLAGFAPGFTGTHVQAGLPPVTLVADGRLTFTGCLQAIATQIGGYFFVEDLDLYLFLTLTTDLPDPLDAAHGRFLDDPPITLTTDLSQVRTLVYGTGHGEAVAGPVPAGSTTIPIADAAPFTLAPGGGLAIVG